MSCELLYDIICSIGLENTAAQCCQTPRLNNTQGEIEMLMMNRWSWDVLTPHDCKPLHEIEVTTSEGFAAEILQKNA